MDLLRIVIKKVDQDVEGDPPLEEPEVVPQVLSKIPQVDPQDPDLGVLNHLIMDLPLVEMDLLTTASKDLHLEEVGAVLTVEVAEVLTAAVEVLTATDLEAAEVAEVFAMDLLDLEDLDPGVTTMVDPQEDLLDQDQIGIKVLEVLTAVVLAVLTAAVLEVEAEETVEAVEVLTVGVAEVLMTAMDQMDQIGTKAVLVVQTAVVLAVLIAAVLAVVAVVIAGVVEVMTEGVAEVLMTETVPLTAEVLIHVTGLPAVVLAGEMTAEAMTAEAVEVVVEVKTAGVKDLEVNLYPMTAKRERVGPCGT